MEEQEVQERLGCDESKKQQAALENHQRRSYFEL